MLRYKSKYFWEFTKEEAWLSEMAQQGWMLVGRTAFERYVFEQGEPHAWNYRIDYRTFKSAADFSDYVQMFEDSGWQLVAGKKSSGRQYFVQVRPGGDPDIFSDEASKAARYRRQSTLWLWFAIVFAAVFVAYLINGIIDLEAMLDPKALYLTPGLWDMSGINFWRAFIFETPFALMRGFSWLIFLAVPAIYLYLALRSLVANRKGRYPSDR